MSWISERTTFALSVASCHQNKEKYAKYSLFPKFAKVSVSEDFPIKIIFNRQRPFLSLVYFMKLGKENGGDISDIKFSIIISLITIVNNIV